MRNSCFFNRAKPRVLLYGPHKLKVIGHRGANGVMKRKNTIAMIPKALEAKKLI